MATSVPLLSGSNDIEMIDIDLVTRMHSKHIKLANKHSAEMREQLIAALGGIDCIIENYVMHNIIDQEQLNLIHSILSKKELSNSDIDLNHNPPIYGTIILNSKETFLHNIFSATTTDKIINLLYHKFIATFLGFCLLFHAICVFLRFIVIVEWFDSFIYRIPFSIFNLTAFFYLSLIVLTVNRRAFSLCVKSFEFWIKIYYAMQFTLASFVIDFQDVNFTASDRFTHLCYYLQIILVVLVFSLMDGLNIAVWKKSSMAVGFALLISVFAVFDTITDDFDYALDIDGIPFSIPLTDLITSSNQILAIFLWKQSIMLVWKRNKATIISTWINIKWINDNEKVSEVIVVNR